ncbi:MAG: hypothetical protein C0594_00765, partial [Marinilabiliales bacterium]
KNTAQSSISYRKSFANTPFNLSANFYHSQNFRDTTITLKLPNIMFSMNRIYPFKRKNKVGKTKIYEKIGIGYNTNFSNNITAKEYDLFEGRAWSEFKNGVKHTVDASTSEKLLKFLTFSPSARYTERWYFKQVQQHYAYKLISETDTTYNQTMLDTNGGFYRVYDYDFRASFSTKMYGMYQFKKNSAVKAIRHVLTPSVSYSYRPDFGQSKYGYYDELQLDTLGNRRSYSYYDGFIFGTAPSGKAGNVNFTLNNNLEMKVRSKEDTVTGTKKIKLLESFNISTSYNLAADSLNWQPLKISGRTQIIKNIGLTFGATIEPYAIDTLGNDINTFQWDASKNPAAYIDRDAGINVGRLVRYQAAVNMSFSSKKGEDKKKEKEETLGADYLDFYADFDIPWNFRINYNINMSKKFDKEEVQYEKNFTQTLRGSGDINLTSKWKIGVSSGYDIVNHKFTTTSVDIYRDLHCWEMTFNWVPFGKSMSYNFTLRAKSSILQDLKLNKRKSWMDNF